jgi:hypothetical protein
MPTLKIDKNLELVSKLTGSQSAATMTDDRVLSESLRILEGLAAVLRPGARHA